SSCGILAAARAAWQPPRRSLVLELLGFSAPDAFEQHPDRGTGFHTWTPCRRTSTCCTGGFILNSLSDAEGRKDGAEEILAAEGARDFAQRPLHRAQILGQQFRAGTRQCRTCAGQMRTRSLEREHVAMARAECAFDFPRCDKAFQFVAQQVETGAGARRQRDLHDAIGFTACRYALV